MADNKIAIKIIPPSAAESISEENLVRFSQIVKIPVDQIKTRISQSKSIIIVTREHPRVYQVIETVKSFGFFVEIVPADKYRVQLGLCGRARPFLNYPTSIRAGMEYRRYYRESL